MCALAPAGPSLALVRRETRLDAGDRRREVAGVTVLPVARLGVPLVRIPSPRLMRAVLDHLVGVGSVHVHLDAGDRRAVPDASVRLVVDVGGVGESR